MIHSAAADPTWVRRKSGSPSIRISYSRPAKPQDVSAGLFQWDSSVTADQLPVTHMDETGIVVSLPTPLAGIFTLEIRDGDRTFQHRLLLQ